MNKNCEKREQIASMPDENTLALFLREINRIPLLSREEEESCAKSAMAGNRAAKEKLVNSNLRFVVNIAKKYQGLGLPLEDLVAEGSIGLLSAAARFDAGKNCRFISYAVWWIRQAVLSAICEKARMIRLPANRSAELFKINNAKKFLKKECSAESEITEIADILNLDKTKVDELLNISKEVLSLDNPVSVEEDLKLIDLIEDNQYKTPDEVVEQIVMGSEIEKVLNTLEKDEAEIIRCHFGIGRLRPMSLKEIGHRYNLSKERIRQIEEKALCRLRDPSRLNKLQVYVA